MALKWKAALILIFVPYVLYLFGALLIAAYLHQIHVFTSWLTLKHLLHLLAYCAIPAVLVNAVLWLLPMQRGWVGATSGALLSVAFLAAEARIEMPGGVVSRRT
jgi:hypothetical protein